ncbi:AAA family ATPase [Agrococcus casei]|uniref:AAA family ATPase n=1 Tax=Agrococcus casei TaxID=343512 RepID=UPI003F8EA28A
MMQTLAVEGYRSISSLVLGLERLTVVTGANGTGKSNLYRSLQLLADCGQGRMISSLARSGGLGSVRFAGEGPQPSPVSLRLGFASDSIGYAIDIGLPQVGDSMFRHDPEIKQEHIFAGDVLRPATTLLERRRGLVKADGVRLQQNMPAWQSVLDEQAGNESVPEAGAVRRELRSWRFHDAFRTDANAPARRPQVATRSFRLDDDGANLAAVLQTTIENGGEAEIALAAVHHAFKGSTLEIQGDASGLVAGLRQSGLARVMTAGELSDGTLQFLLLVAALTSVESPGLLVLNEPERSLHSSLMPALARLITQTSERTQTIVVTHHADLTRLLGGASVELRKSVARTTVAGREGRLDQPVWAWPKR